MIKKLVKIAIKTFAIIIVVAIVAVLGFMLAEPLIYNDFYSRGSQKEFATPGAGDDFIQQGFCYAGNDVILASGYMKGKKPSRIYIVKGTNYDDRTTTYVQLKDEKGKYTTNHAGGVSVFKDKVYVCNSEGDPSSVLIYSLSEILSANEGDDVEAKQNVPVHTNASFCHVENGVLYVGEFYMEGKYKTDDSHKIITPAGDKNNAMVFGYLLDSDGDIYADAPIGAFSITDKIQGMTFANGKIVLSSSYGLATSKLYVYDVQTAKNQPQSTTIVANKNVPLICLDSASLVDTISAPPMAEEMVYLNGRLLVIGESASNKYIFGKLLRAKHVWSIEL
ncbi:MAG: hypothetical protein E7344_06080 [Clostridiales bacterium]|nr:hypothetical protein [Clostridiales bacterium]